MKIPKPDSESPDSKFFDSVEISGLVELSTLSEISTKKYKFQKSRFLGVFRAILGSRIRIWPLYDRWRHFEALGSFLNPFPHFPATLGRFPAMIGYLHHMADQWPETGRELKFFKKFLCVGKLRP